MLVDAGDSFPEQTIELDRRHRIGLVVSHGFDLRGDEADLAHMADGLMKRPNAVGYVDSPGVPKDARRASESLWAASKHFSFEPLCVNLNEIRAIGTYQIVERSHFYRFGTGES